MPVKLTAPDPASLLPVAGVRLGIASAGIKKPGRRDITLIELAPGSRVAGVFTQNRFCAAPVTLCKQHLGQIDPSGGDIRALVINTGNANAGTGEEGLNRARRTCEAVAGLFGVKAEQVLPFSTGVILEPLLNIERTALAITAGTKIRKTSRSWKIGSRARCRARERVMLESATA